MVSIGEKLDTITPLPLGRKVKGVKDQSSISKTFPEHFFLVLHQESNNYLEVGDDDDVMLCISKDVPKMQKLEQAGGRLIVSTKMQIVRANKNNIY